MKKIDELKSKRVSEDGEKLRAVNFFIPDKIYQSIRKQAYKNYRSVSAEARFMLEEAIGGKKE